jgi:hypothetical protein
MEMERMLVDEVLQWLLAVWSQEWGKVLGTL